ncbi:protein BLISTER-like isoform X2 [Nicotiana tomentosiformis]|uniref:protein BLISTER-like isoform X2 n=1 Tax=Nicotiana tomentosiformis TaxID=4098 RepID=UPI00051CA9C8|nr:protein BLISTER-like [Nicotiana tomentosiformis]
MASAQVLRKQEHLQAGKKKLEEFRKQRAAQRAKKSTSNNQLHNPDGGSENQSSENEHARIIDSRRAGTSDAAGGAALELARVDVKHDFMNPDLSRKSGFASSYDANASFTHSLYNNDNDASTISSVSGNNNGFDSSISVSSHSGDEVFKGAESPKLSKQFSNSYDSSEKTENYGALGTVGFGFNGSHSTANFLSSAPSYNKISSQFTHDGLGKSIPEDNNRKDLSVIDTGTSHSAPANVSPENSLGPQLQEKPGYMDPWASGLTSSSYEDYMHPATSSTNSSLEVGQKDSAVEANSSMVSDIGHGQFSSSGFYMTNNSSSWASDGISSEARSSSTYSKMSPPTVGRRSRPSFLDSISISKVPAISPSQTESVSADRFDPKVHPTDTLESSNSINMMNSSTFSAKGSDKLNHHTEKDTGNMDNHYQFYAKKQNEDFAALEQHIEDLTQEKFSSQRALEASRALAESLAAENSALTESYNQQGSFVTQLKADIENLQAEIKAQLVELEALKMEYANIQLECNAADERAKLLASEVIGLEEKALRLRSNELKLERELEKSQAEMSSFRKKMASLEKDRQDLLSTIDALKEEKKLLQAKLRKASGSGKSLDVSRSMPSKRDVSTSTEDLCEDKVVNTTMDDPDLEAHSTEGPTFSYLPENEQLSLESLSTAIPPDQIRMIQNINTLLSELALEKEELMKALSLESSQCSKLQEVNKDLTRKLEAQTQRLELLTAQSMATGNNQARQPDALSVHDSTTYADEGDEVVERVLGWIIKLFPGGPSRQRTSKLI